MCSSQRLMFLFFKWEYLIYLVGLQSYFFPDGHPFAQHHLLNNDLFFTDLKYHLYSYTKLLYVFGVIQAFLVCFSALTVYSCADTMF